MRVSSFNYAAPDYPFCGSRFAQVAVCFVLSFAPVQCIADESSAPGDLTVFEHFKKFIEDPPPIEDIVFSYLGPPASRFDYSRKKFVQERAALRYTRAAWGSEYLLTVSMPSLHDLEVAPLTEGFDLKEGVMLIQSKDNLWSFVGHNRNVIFWKGFPTYPLDQTNPVIVAYDYQNSPLFALLNMGPHFVPPRAIHWSGDRFEYVARLSDTDFVIEGELFQGAANGFPEKMLLRYRSRYADGRYLVRYDYGTNSSTLPRFIPEHVHSVVFHGNDEFPDKDIRIFSLKLATAPNKSRGFDTKGWISQKQLTQFVYTNHELYAIDPSGAARWIPHSKEKVRPPFILAHANRYYYVLCGIISSGFLIVTLRMRKQTNQQTSH